MKLFTVQEKIMYIKILADLLLLIEESQDINELKKYLDRKMKETARMI